MRNGALRWIEKPMNSKNVLYIVKRILLALLTVWVVITITFFVMHAVPGGPFLGEKAMSAATIKALEAKYGMDKPLMTQYFTYLKDIVTRFDFGPSIKQRGRMVIDVIADGMQTSAKLGLIAAFIALIIGVVLGAVAALRRNRIIDKVIMVLTTAFVSMPSFIMGVLFLIAFVIRLKWLPGNGATAGGLVLPIITLSLYPMAKGVSKWKIIFGHAMKNSLIPVITYFGPMIAYIVTGSIVVEQIFAVPGIGRFFVSSIINRDYPMIMGTTIILAILIVVMNMVSDILYKVVDPRIKLD